jgi:hypothetical protein
MTKRFFKILWPVTVAAALAMTSVPVEAGDIRCRIPFDFTMKGKTLPAGTYDVTDERGVLTLRGDTDGGIVLTTRVGGYGDSRRRLVFQKYGEVYVLRQAWTGGAGSLLPESRHDRELARAAAGATSASTARIVVPEL